MNRKGFILFQYVHLNTKSYKFNITIKGREMGERGLGRLNDSDRAWLELRESSYEMVLGKMMIGHLTTYHDTLQ